jgi:hypothetical protein
MKNTINSDLVETLNQKEKTPPLNFPRSDAEYRRILPSRFYRVGETLVLIQAGFMAWGFFVGLNDWAILLSALISFFGIVFLGRHRSETPEQHEWIITKLTILSLCLIVQLLLSVKGDALICV